MTIEELSDTEKVDLFRRMVQTGAIAAAQRTGQDNSVHTAMTAVEVAATITIEDIPNGVSPAAAAFQFIEHFCLGGRRPARLRI